MFVEGIVVDTVLDCAVVDTVFDSIVVATGLDVVEADVEFGLIDEEFEGSFWLYMIAIKTIIIIATTIRITNLFIKSLLI